MAVNINRLVMTGNLTRDPELRTTPSGTEVCSMRIACNTRRKDSSGEWADKANYFDVVAWGAMGVNCATYLEKGRPVAVDGRLEWREWTDRDGNKRQSVDIVADNVQFLGSREGGGDRAPHPAEATDVPVPSGQEDQAYEDAKAAREAADDIPF